MNAFLRILILLWICCSPVFAQLRYTYDFSDGLNGVEPGAPPLRILGKTGEIRDEPIKELKGNKKLAYFFEANSGLAFDNNLGKGFLDKSYSIELYFSFKNLEDWRRVIDFKNRKSDNGCYILNGQVNFFNFAVGQNAAVRPNKYTHYIFTRDHKRNYIQIYVDGELKLEFPDKGKEASLDKDQVINFFQDDLVVNHESSEGSVAYIRVYDEVVDPIFVKRRFRNLLANLRRGASDAVVKEEEEIELEIPDDVMLKGRIYDSQTLQPLGGGKLKLKTLSDSLIAVNKLTSGDYLLKIRPERHYKLDVYVTGYKPYSFAIEPIQVNESLRKNIRLEKEVFEEPLVIVPFEQSDATIKETEWVRIVIEFLKERPELGIKIDGHSDSVGDFDKNVRLSEERALEIKNVLIQQGVAEQRIKVQGYGPVRPLSHNNIEKGRMRNRRVEVWPIHLEE